MKHTCIDHIDKNCQKNKISNLRLSFIPVTDGDKKSKLGKEPITSDDVIHEDYQMQIKTIK